MFTRSIASQTWGVPPRDGGASDVLNQDTGPSAAVGAAAPTGKIADLWPYASVIERGPMAVAAWQQTNGGDHEELDQ